MTPAGSRDTSCTAAPVLELGTPATAGSGHDNRGASSSASNIAGRKCSKKEMGGAVGSAPPIAATPGEESASLESKSKIDNVGTSIDLITAVVRKILRIVVR